MSFEERKREPTFESIKRRLYTRTLVGRGPYGAQVRRPRESASKSFALAYLAAAAGLLLAKTRPPLLSAGEHIWALAKQPFTRCRENNYLYSHAA